MWGCGVASREVLDCVGWGGRGIEDLGRCGGTAVMGGVLQVFGWVQCDMPELASGLDSMAFDRGS